MKRKVKSILELKYVKILVDTIKDFTSNESMSFAAGTAFYTIFSLPAFLIIILNLGASLYERSEIREQLLGRISSLAGEESRKTLESILENFALNADNTVSATIAIIILVFSATTVFVSLQRGMNHIWHIKPKPDKGWLKLAIDRVLSFSVVLVIGLILIISLLLDAIISYSFGKLDNLFPDVNLQLISIGQLIISQLILVVIFALMYKILPDAKVKWKDTWTGAIVTTMLFVIGKFLIGLYMSNNDLSTTYGAAGSLVILLVWIYYSLVIFLFGAQVTYYIAKNIGGGVVPRAEAIRVEETEVEEEPRN
ncbi:YihY/virulence factor BrkB family protein [Psychroflexus sp. YR1-1]|uniref:YihY/virulence factor BrkB family protein n=1 Tax=Psychroflexus aurantiacus TaxID=2709310 RepID=A0A6B3R971_9FLAO|nr:YihY/virulence factor BrkB family protein [Psychroflexus aurantiacus]NEV94104.1 YihY/virulence factor BrkB family protein [Psychroflexus aurantiacus]